MDPLKEKMQKLLREHEIQSILEILVNLTRERRAELLKSTKESHNLLNRSNTLLDLQIDLDRAFLTSGRIFSADNHL